MVYISNVCCLFCVAVDDSGPVSMALHNIRNNLCASVEIQCL